MRGVNGEISSNVSETRFRCLVFRGERFARYKAGFWAISALVLSLLFVSPVYAEGMNTVIYGPISYSFSGERYTEIGVAAYNKYDAALVALGYNPDGEAFTDDVKAYLSNESTGSAFYSFAQGFVHPPTDGYGLENPGFWSTAYSIYGTGHVWRSEFTAAQRISAVTAVGLVLAGDIPGSGGGSGGSSNRFVGTSYYYNGSSSNFGRYKFRASGGTDYSMALADVRNGATLMPSQYYVDLPDASLNHVYELYSPDDYDYYLTMDEYQNSNPDNTTLGCNVYIVPKGKGELVYAQSTVGDVTQNVPTQLKATESLSYRKFSLSRRSYTFDGTVFTLSTPQYTSTPSSYSASSNSNIVSVTSGGIIGCVLYIDAGGSGGTPPVPPTDWPDEPTPDPPTQPTVPDPPTGGTPPITNPITYPIDNTVVNNTYTVDIQGILDAMADHCQHIRDSIYQNCKRIYDGITDYMEDLASWWGTLYQSTMLDVCDYLQELFEWLADQFDYSVSGTGYNDNTVVSWLRKIYSKLGGGINTRPVDPVVDPPGFGDWFNQLLQNLVLDLLAIGQDVLADLVESFRELITKFPFCIPWDIAAMLALLVAEPEAPNVDWPVYTLSINGGLTQVATYEIDLSEYDSVMGGIRAMETFLFAGWLAFKTDFFKSMVSGFGGAK